LIKKKKNGKKIMHCVLKLQRNTLSFEIKEEDCIIFSIQNTAISILSFTWDAGIHRGLELRLKEFHVLRG